MNSRIIVPRSRYFQSIAAAAAGGVSWGSLRAALLLAVVFVLVCGTAAAQLEDLKKPEPTVPEAFTLQGEFVRMAYNNEGFVTLGYRTANDSVGEEWMLLEMGVTLRKGIKEQKLTRDDLTLTTPDGKIISLASQKEFNKANLRALDRRASMVRDSIDYFPISANLPCAMRFFADPSVGPRVLAYDEVSLSFQRACVGRIYFHVPGGITPGQYWLNVRFEGSTVQVPFRIFTEEEGKAFRKQWKDIKKEHEAGTK